MALMYVSVNMGRKNPLEWFVCEWFVEVMVSFTVAMASRHGGAAGAMALRHDGAVADGWRLEWDVLGV